MTFYQKLLRNLKISSSILLLVSAFGCGIEEEPIDRNVLARVHDSVLTENQLERKLNTEKYENKSKEEYIRKWIETEVLFREAQKQKVTQRQTYLNIVEESAKNIAASLFLKEYFDNYEFDYSTDELRDYYEKHKSEFRVSTTSVVLNQIEVDNRELAEEFRSEVIVDNWRKASKKYSDNSNINITEKKFIKSYKINSLRLKRLIEKLQVGDISIVLKTEQNKYIVVQLVERLLKNSVPGFEYVEDEVKERYLMLLKQKEYDKLINKLYTKYNVEIIGNTK